MNYKLFSLVSGTLILSSLSASGQQKQHKAEYPLHPLR